MSKLSPIGDVTVHVTPKVIIKVGAIALVVGLIFVAGLFGYNIGKAESWNRVEEAIVQTELIQVKAAELEAEILHLRNYAILIDAIATQGQAVRELQDLPLFLPCTVEVTDTVPESFKGAGGP